MIASKFHAVPANPFDESGPWIDDGGQYVYRTTGWQLSPVEAQRNLLLRENFMHKQKEFYAAIRTPITVP